MPTEEHTASGRGQDAEAEAAIDNAAAAALKICCHCHKSLSDSELFDAVRPNLVPFTCLVRFTSVRLVPTFCLCWPRWQVEKVMNRLPLEHDAAEMKTVGDLLFHFLLERCVCGGACAVVRVRYWA